MSGLTSPDHQAITQKMELEKSRLEEEIIEKQTELCHLRTRLRMINDDIKRTKTVDIRLKEVNAKVAIRHKRYMEKFKQIDSLEIEVKQLRDTYRSYLLSLDTYSLNGFDPNLLEETGRPVKERVPDHIKGKDRTRELQRNGSRYKRVYLKWLLDEKEKLVNLWTFFVFTDNA